MASYNKSKVDAFDGLFAQVVTAHPERQNGIRECLESFKKMFETYNPQDPVHRDIVLSDDKSVDFAGLLLKMASDVGKDKYVHPVSRSLWYAKKANDLSKLDQKADPIRHMSHGFECAFKVLVNLGFNPYDQKELEGDRNALGLIQGALNTFCQGINAVRPQAQRIQDEINEAIAEEEETQDLSKEERGQIKRAIKEVQQMKTARLEHRDRDFLTNIERLLDTVITADDFEPCHQLMRKGCEFLIRLFGARNLTDEDFERAQGEANELAEAGKELDAEYFDAFQWMEQALDFIAERAHPRHFVATFHSEAQYIEESFNNPRIFGILKLMLAAIDKRYPPKPGKAFSSSSSSAAPVAVINLAGDETEDEKDDVKMTIPSVVRGTSGSSVQVPQNVGEINQLIEVTKSLLQQTYRDGKPGIVSLTAVGMQKGTEELLKSLVMTLEYLRDFPHLTVCFQLAREACRGLLPLLSSVLTHEQYNDYKRLVSNLNRNHTARNKSGKYNLPGDNEDRNFKLTNSIVPTANSFAVAFSKQTALTGFMGAKAAPLSSILASVIRLIDEKGVPELVKKPKRIRKKAVAKDDDESDSEEEAAPSMAGLVVSRPNEDVRMSSIPSGSEISAVISRIEELKLRIPRDDNGDFGVNRHDGTIKLLSCLGTSLSGLQPGGNLDDAELVSKGCDYLTSLFGSSLSTDAWTKTRKNAFAWIKARQPTFYTNSGPSRIRRFADAIGDALFPFTRRDALVSFLGSDNCQLIAEIAKFLSDLIAAKNPSKKAVAKKMPNKPQEVKVPVIQVPEPFELSIYAQREPLTPLVTTNSPSPAIKMGISIPVVATVPVDYDVNMLVTFPTRDCFIVGGRSRKVQVRNSADGALIGDFQVTDSEFPNVTAACFSRDAKQLAIGGDSSFVSIWDLQDPKNMKLAHNLVVRDKVGTAHTLLFSASGKSLITCFSTDGTPPVNSWKTDTGKLDWTLKELSFRDDKAIDICLSKDSTKLFCASRNGAVSVWSTDTSPPTRKADCDWEYAEPPGVATRIEFSPSGDRIAMGTQVGNLILWDYESLNCVAAPSSDDDAPVVSISFSPNGRFIAWATRRCIRISQSSRGDLVAELPMRGCAVARFSLDGKRLIAGSVKGTKEHLLTIWDVSKLYR